jgi:hypothetical protein
MRETGANGADHPVERVSGAKTMPIPTYKVLIHCHECTVKAATREDAVRAAVSTLWDQITATFRLGRRYDGWKVEVAVPDVCLRHERGSQE